MTSAPDGYAKNLEDYLYAWAVKTSSFGKELGARPFIDVMNSLLPGGKRLRARFLSAGWRMAGGSACHGSEVSAGAALELFQLAALVHDDLIDRSDTRRGIPAAHRQFGQLLGDNALASDIERYSLAGAVLLGDMLTVSASQVFEEAITQIPAERHASARAHFQEMMSEVTFGQFLDVSSQFQPFAKDLDSEIEWSWRVLKHKSARYSIEHPLTLGATLAGADSDLLRVLADVGLLLGEAFQLRDDVLGVFGDPAQTGKPTGDDIREGKRTILLLETARRCDSDDLIFLNNIVGKDSLSTAEIDQARKIILRTEALNQVERYIDERLQKALILLSQYEGLNGVEFLFDLARTSSHRAL